MDYGAKNERAKRMFFRTRKDCKKAAEPANAVQGRWGENVAERHLAAMGWKTIGRNVRPCERDRRCEIDRIFRAPNGCVVFVEVKTHMRRSERASRLFGVDRRKKNALLRACAGWIMKNHWHGCFRFDVVEVYGSHSSAASPEVDHIENVRLFPPKWRFW